MTNGSTNDQLWQLDSVYPGLESREYQDDVKELERLITEAGSLFAQTPETKSVGIDWLRRSLELLSQFYTLNETLQSYLYCLYSTNTRDSGIMAKLNALEAMVVPAHTAEVKFRNSLAQACRRGFFGEVLTGPESISASVSGLPEDLKAYRFVLAEGLEQQIHQMSPELEDLAADLNRSGGEAWGRLQQQISSNLSMPWDDTGKQNSTDSKAAKDSDTSVQQKTVIELRSLAYDADRNIRKKAYDLELAAWKQVEIPIAAAINGVKGFSISVNSRRGYQETLDRSVSQNRITRKTLDAMISAMENHLPHFRTYLNRKAELLGLPKLAFYDIFAPLVPTGDAGLASGPTAGLVGDSTGGLVGESPAGGLVTGGAMFDSGEATGASADGASNADSPGSAGQVKTWTYPEAREFIIQTFHGFSDDLGNFAAQAFDKRWIDAQPRTGKVGGAYCTDLPKPGESRILANFDGSFSSVSTLAHELGHAYHSYVLRDQPQLLRGYPMTLAETASIFCETIIYNTAIGNSQGFERLSLVEGILSESTQVIVDILSRFYFEKALFAARQESELSADQLCAAMLDAQKATYGDGLNQDELHPYMWAVKGHYYSPELAFYNFPYAFGQLFGLGLYAQYQNDPQGFPGVYRELLIETGRANAVDVCKTAGFDIESTDFWNQGLSAIVTHVNTFTKGSK